jgi:hypothetical protein
MKLTVAVPALVSCAVPMLWIESHEAAAASQKLTCPVFNGAEPEVTVALSVTTVPEATDWTDLPAA